MVSVHGLSLLCLKRDSAIPSQLSSITVLVNWKRTALITLLGTFSIIWWKYFVKIINYQAVACICFLLGSLLIYTERGKIWLKGWCLWSLTNSSCCSADAVFCADLVHKPKNVNKEGKREIIHLFISLEINNINWPKRPMPKSSVWDSENKERIYGHYLAKRQNWNWTLA